MKQAEFYYCRFGEDILIYDIFGDAKGQYISFGEEDPVYNSITKLLYQKGWRGLQVVRNSRAKELIEFDRKRDVVVQKTKPLDELSKEHKLNHVIFVAAQSLADIESNNWEKISPTVIFMQNAKGAAELLKPKGYDRVYSRGRSAVFSMQKLSTDTHDDLILFADYQKRELAREQTLVLERSLRDEKHARIVLEQKIPLLPFAKLLFKNIDGKINAFMEKKQRLEPMFDPQAKVGIISPNISGLKELKRSYADSIKLQQAGPGVVARPFKAIFWFLYRIIRKVGKIIFRLIRRPASRVKEQAS